MISVEEAVDLALRHVVPLPAREIAAGESLGHILAEDVLADVDSPPYAKSLWDGFAVRAADIQGGRTDYEILERVTAGELPQRAVTLGTATEVMTGAPLPAGADSIVIVERSRPISAPGPRRVQLSDPHFTPGQGVMHQGDAMRKGDVALPRGTRIRPAEIGLLAEAGRERLRVHESPVVAVLATGNELESTAAAPRPGRIRNTNGPMLSACVQSAGGAVIDLGIARDDEGELRDRIAHALARAHCVLLSGGVSAGVLDLVPNVLVSLGVEQVFHKINLKPGKPLWFGVSNKHGRRQLVFGLPGNPVSTLVCFELFVRPAINALRGHAAATQEIAARLEASHSHKGDRVTYFPASLTWLEGTPWVKPLPWRGSADLRTLTQANALIRFAGESRTYDRGESVSVRTL